MIRILECSAFDGKRILQKIAITNLSDLDKIDKTRLLESSTAKYFNLSTGKIELYYFTEQDNNFHLVQM